MTEELKDVDKNLAFIMELVAGLFGLLGIGYMYAGDITGGVIRLIVWLVGLAIIWTMIAFLTFLLIGLCLIPVMVVVHVVVPLLSALALKKRLDEAYPEK